jgi:flagellar basal body-associated protein FliL
MSSSIMEDKESTSVLRVVIGLVTVLTFGAFAAMYFFVGETSTDTHQNKTEAKQVAPAPNSNPHPVDLL